MKKISLSIAISTLFTIFCFAQRDFRDGYIITNQLDTIYGQIDYRGDIRNSKVCSFTKNSTNQSIDYLPDEIFAYRFIDGRYYISKELDNGKKVFLEFLVNGMANLYYYRDEKFTDYYFIEKNNRLSELKIDRRKIHTGDKEVIRTRKTYIGTLKGVLQVWEMNETIEKAKLEHNSLIDIAKDYHKHTCMDESECIVYERQKPLITVHIAPMLGLDISSIKIKDNIHSDYNFDCSSNISLGVNIKYSMPRINEKFFLQLYGLYTKYYYYTNFISPNSFKDIHIYSHLMKLGVAPKYVYPKGQWRPTIAVGFSYAFLLNSSKKEYIDAVSSHNEIRPSSTKLKNVLLKNLLGGDINLGVQHLLKDKYLFFAQIQYSYMSKKEKEVSINIQSINISTGIFF
ncbi:MAG: outer membrane beta-barrel protein [Bacteroidales bacterium]|jgi:hypothetical protein|nr:outer membrane beta-barrel protein [Bacteroidales bacterium]